MDNMYVCSVEIGVTTHSPETLQFPATMTGVKTGTWMLSENHVVCNSSKKTKLQVDLESFKVTSCD